MECTQGLQDLLTLAGRLGSDYQVVLIGLIEKQLPDIPSDVLGLLRTANQTELAQWYSTADVFVNPTYEETFGLTTVEPRHAERQWWYTKRTVVLKR